MSPPATLSRNEFNQACTELVEKHSKYISSSGNSDVLGSLLGWAWTVHPQIPGWGYLNRTTTSKDKSDSKDDEEYEGLNADELFEPYDESNVSATPDVDLIYLHESIVWHPTYMVPAYYFQAYDSGGAATSLTRILATDRFQHRAFRNAGLAVSGVAVQHEEDINARFPLLSQGDHPILGTPYWYFHPCETSTAVTELLTQMSDPSSSSHPLSWLETWFAVLSTAIDLRR